MPKKGKGKRGSTSEKEYKKLSKKVESELKKGQINNVFDLSKETKISDQLKRTNKVGKGTKEQKSVKDMSREELIKSATSTAQHANKTIRDFEKADKGHFHTPGRLLSIAEEYDIKTKGNRVSRSFKKLTDNQLRDFIVKAKQTYTGKTVKKAVEESSRQRLNAEGTIKDRFPNVDVSKLKELSDSDFNEIFGRLKTEMESKDTKNKTSDEVLLEILADYGLTNEDEEDSLALAFQRQREASDRLNRNKATNRNRGKKR